MTEPLRINGEDQPFAAMSVAALLQARGIAEKRGLAVAVNGAVVPTLLWPETKLNPGDAVEIVRPFGGG
ncbi:MAG: sulfur carrier protein ThiS [Stellaceae bacterium]